MEDIEKKPDEAIISDGNTEIVNHGNVNANEEDHKKGTVIIVNTRPHKVYTKQVTYEQIVVYAFGVIPIDIDPNIVITVSFRNGREPKPKGQLMPGQSVLVKDKMVFDAARGDKS